MKIPYWLLLMIFVAIKTQAQTDQQQTYQLQELADNLNYPWSLAFLPEGEFLITEKNGQLKRLDQQGKLIASMSSDLPNLLNLGQGGLLEVILSPDFNVSRRIMLSYVCGSVKANSVCLASAILADNKITAIQQIFRAQPDRKDTAHFGGRMVFLPDNTLILTLGDGFDYREQAQNPANHLGKILRLNIDGSAPTDNPFIDKAGYAPEIYTLG